MGLLETLGRSFLLVALLQIPDDAETQLEHERLSIRAGVLPQVEVVRVRSVHRDGTPARGSISCSGTWRKFDETPTYDEWLPFKTDTTGAILLNPWIGDYQDDPMVCSALDRHGHTGSVTFTMPSSYQEITVR